MAMRKKRLNTLLQQSPVSSAAKQKIPALIDKNQTEFCLSRENECTDRTNWVGGIELDEIERLHFFLTVKNVFGP